MKIKNLAIATILTLSTATAVLTINNNDVIQTKAASNTNYTSEIVKTRKIGNSNYNIAFQYIDRYISETDQQHQELYCITTYYQTERFKTAIYVNVTLFLKANINVYNVEYKPSWQQIDSLWEIKNYQATGQTAQEYYNSLTTYNDIDDLYNTVVDPQAEYVINTSNYNLYKSTNLPNMNLNEYYLYITTGYTNTIEIYKPTDNKPKDVPFTEFTPNGFIQLYDTPIIVVNEGNYEVVDIGGLMLQIISMPFSFISTAFNLTLFPGTPYQINIGNFILGILAILTILFIIKIFTGGLDIIGNITQSAASHTKSKTKVINANNNLKAAKTNNKAVKTKAEKK